MDEIKLIIKEEILKQNEILLYILIYSCGGIMFLRQFYALLGNQDKKLIEYLTETKLIRITHLGKNKLIIAKHALFKHFGIPNKSAELTGKRILHSSLVAEMFYRTYGTDLERIKKILLSGNLCYYSASDSLNFLVRIYNFLSKSKIDGLCNLKTVIEEHRRKSEFFQSNRKGKTDKLVKSLLFTEDLFTLKNKNIYIRYADFANNILVIHVAVFSYSDNSEKLAKAITIAERTLRDDIFSELNIKISFDIYSHNKPNTNLKERVKKILLKQKDFTTQQSHIDNDIVFHWYNSKNTLFSGVEINRWL